MQARARARVTSNPTSELHRSPNVFRPWYLLLNRLIAMQTSLNRRYDREVRRSTSLQEENKGEPFASSPCLFLMPGNIVQTPHARVNQSKLYSSPNWSSGLKIAMDVSTFSGARESRSRICPPHLSRTTSHELPPAFPVLFCRQQLLERAPLQRQADGAPPKNFQEWMQDRDSLREELASYKYRAEVCASLPCGPPWRLPASTILKFRGPSRHYVGGRGKGEGLGKKMRFAARRTGRAWPWLF